MEARTLLLVIAVATMSQVASAQFLSPDAIHHEIIVGGGGWHAYGDLTGHDAYWYYPGLINTRRKTEAFNPIYATRGDRLVFIWREGVAPNGCRDLSCTFDLKVTTDEREFNNCNLPNTRPSYRSSSNKLVQNNWNRKIVVNLKEAGEFFFAEMGMRWDPRFGLQRSFCQELNQKIRVNVDTGRTPQWPVGNVGRELRTHEWKVGAASTGWGQITSSSAMGFAPIWAALGDYVTFDYDKSSDVFQFNGKLWFDTCNFVFGQRVSSPEAGCDTARDGYFPCVKRNRYVKKVEGTNTMYYSSATSTFYSGNFMANNVWSQLFESYLGNTYQNLVAFQNFACTTGKQKLEVHGYGQDRQVNVGPCFGNYGLGGSLDVTSTFSYFGFNNLFLGLFGSEECFDLQSYLHGTQDSVYANSVFHDNVAKTVPNPSSMA